VDRILRFKPHLRVERAGDGRLFLIGERERLLLPGHLAGSVAALVDGRRSEREIPEALAGEASPPEIYFALRQLERSGYIAEAVAGLAPEAAAYWYAVGVDAARAAGRLAATPVEVKVTGGEATAPLVDALGAAGVAVGPGALWIVAAGDYLDPELGAIDRRARAEGARWMPVKPSGAVAWIGPMFGSSVGQGGGPCWECLAHRLRANRPVEAFIERSLGRAEPIAPPRSGLAAGARAALSLAALALARAIAEERPGPERLVAVDMARLRVEEHAVARRPQCPVCGDPGLFAAQAERRLVLAARPRHFSDDGGYRSAAPEETFARHEHLISPLTGVVAMVGPLVERDHPLRPVYRAAYFVCPPADSALDEDKFARPSLGKGRTAAQARAGALCEAIERYSALWQGDEPIRVAPFAELADDAVPPPALLHFSAEQYRRREELNRGERDPRRRIPLPFDERVAIGWTPAWSLTGDRRRYVPAAYSYAHAPAPPEARFCFLDPNGHAAGNCVEEAILQGFLELAERDAVGIWWYGRVRRPGVDLASFAQPYFLDLERHYAELGFRLWVLDLTNDLELPAFAALAHSADQDRTVVGFGCHLEARLGVQRALTELNQLFDPADRSRAPWGEAPLEDPRFLAPAEDLRPRRSDDFAPVDTGDIRDDVFTCVDRAARLGLETLVVDQTRPDVGLHAVKVIVPGLRHFWPRFGPGRLYDVPVRLGWLPRARAEEELNPVPLYL
jgi:bacteriocin biosynthesis cyclodehydratase domain-containing protein